MKSIRQANSRLPEDFTDRLYELYGVHQAEKILRGLSSERATTLRVNTLKMDLRSLMDILSKESIKYDRVSWNQTALIIKNRDEKAIQALDIYKTGSIYLQSLSSQIPPLVLSPGPGQRVLDMTAAPGGKTTQIAAMMQNKGNITAVEVNQIRFERLKYNVDMQGAKIVDVRLEDASLIGKKEPERYDLVLLDAPCSGEGLFQTIHPGTYRYWSLKEVRKLAAEQRRLIGSAVQSLKPGGTLVYSTCTMAPEENEAVVDIALKRFPVLKVQAIDLQVPGTIPGFTSFGDSSYNSEARKAVRVLPSDIMEGFFICKFKKIGSTLGAEPVN